MGYINLIDKLTEHDKEVMKLYIEKNGCRLEDFIGLDKWLENWSHSKQKLYHLLGDSFVKEYPYSYQKNDMELRTEFQKLILDHPIKKEYHHFYLFYIKKAEYINEDQLNFFNHLLDINNFIDDKISYSLKIKKPNANRMLQIQAGTKPIKAIGRVFEYFAEELGYDDYLKDQFEEFKKRYAIILSERTLTGKLCVSIHPMDFMTMSDNASNWTSCMSWEEDGCYHVGTVEMMNSNNVMCAYLIIGDRQFIFDNKVDANGEVLGAWNNKKWRQLIYITKDILMGGKAYPYSSREMTETLLANVKKLAEDNLHWTYEFGPELYQDMIHVNEIYHMNRQREWMRIEKKNPVKHNIIWDTKGMYNDMLNDSRTNYWCYRNKVKHTKIISASGKAPCLCCGSSVISYDEDNGNMYNERYRRVGATICRDCEENLYTCTICGATGHNKKFTTLIHGERVCNYCLNSIRTCPCCGDYFFTNRWNTIMEDYFYNPYLYEDLSKGKTFSHLKYFDSIRGDMDTADIRNLDEEFRHYRQYGEDITEITAERLYACPKCRNVIEGELQLHSKRIAIRRPWSSRDELYWIVKPEDAEKYRATKLVEPPVLSISLGNTPAA